MCEMPRQKIVVVGAGPVGSLAALYAASRGDDVEVYELREGERFVSFTLGVDQSTIFRIIFTFVVLAKCFTRNTQGWLRRNISMRTGM